MRLENQSNFQNYHRVLNRTVWSNLRVSHSGENLTTKDESMILSVMVLQIEDVTTVVQYIA